MNYVLTTGNGTRFLISEEESGIVFGAMKRNDKAVIIQGQLISLQIVPEIIKYDVWFAQENVRLGNQGKKLCKKCLGVVVIGGFCSCKDGAQFAPPNVFSLSLPEISLMLNPPKNV